MKHSGKLITFEGLDGSGKSTQLVLEAERLRGLGFPVTVTREPGGTPVGARIRDIVLNAASEALSAATELALMFAARAQHIEQVILPALRAGNVVLCDRFTDSSVAYQGYGRGIARDVIRTLENVFCQGVRPDLTLILEIDPETGVRRADARNHEAQDKEGRFEREGMEFFARVRQGYQEIAQQEPQRVRVVNGRGSVADVHQRVRCVVDEFLKIAEGRSPHGV